MKILIAVFGIMLLVNTGYTEENTVLKTEKEKLSYSIGMDIGKSLKKQALDVDPDILTRGIKDTFSEGPQLLTEGEFRNTVENFRKEMMAKQRTQSNAVGEKNKKEGKAFLEANKKKKDVVSLPSGLQYKIIKEGEGDVPKLTDTVTVHYKGTLIDGTEFDW